MLSDNVTKMEAKEFAGDHWNEELAQKFDREAKEGCVDRGVRTRRATQHTQKSLPGAA